jgi:hypothetical protein
MTFSLSDIIIWVSLILVFSCVLKASIWRIIHKSRRTLQWIACKKEKPWDGKCSNWRGYMLYTRKIIETFSIDVCTKSDCLITSSGSNHCCDVICVGRKWTGPLFMPFFRTYVIKVNFFRKKKLNVNGASDTLRVTNFIFTFRTVSIYIYLHI